MNSNIVVADAHLNVAFVNNGNGTFTDVTDRAGVAGPAHQWGAGCCFLDFDRDGRVTAFDLLAAHRNMYRWLPLSAMPATATATSLLARPSPVAGGPALAAVVDEAGVA